MEIIVEIEKGIVSGVYTDSEQDITVSIKDCDDQYDERAEGYLEMQEKISSGRFRDALYGGTEAQQSTTAYYVPIHFYERSPSDDSVVKLLVPHNIEQSELQTLINDISKRYQDSYDDEAGGCIDELVDDIFNEVCESIKGEWCYCTTIDTLVIGDVS